MQVLGASFDSAAANRAFRERYRFPFPLLCDERRELALAYQAANSVDDRAPKRISYVIDPNGTIERAYDSVNPLNHADRVLQDLGGASPRRIGILRRLFGR